MHGWVEQWVAKPNVITKFSKYLTREVQLNADVESAIT
jgi:hypothetical protein